MKKQALLTLAVLLSACACPEVVETKKFDDEGKSC